MRSLRSLYFIPPQLNRGVGQQTGIAVIASLATYNGSRYIIAMLLQQTVP